MTGRALIGLVIALGLAGCTPSSELAVVSSPAVPSASTSTATQTAEASFTSSAAEVVIYELRTRNETPLPSAIRRWDGTNYDLSPDGAKLAFDADVDGYHQIFIAGRNGSWVRQLTHDRKDSSNPSWSPGGRRLVYEHGKTIHVTNLRSGDTVRFTYPYGLLQQPSFMPGGRRILFTRLTPNRTDLWMAAASGGQSTRLVAEAAWGVPSPSGRRIAFHRIAGSIEITAWGPYQRGLTLINRGGTNRRPLTRPRGWISIPIDWSFHHVRWSPNGRLIAYDSGLPYEDQLKVVRVSDGAVIRRIDGAKPIWLDNHTLILERTERS
jgi:Tol biopolymer transport system component